jgi:uncharacterized SAM-binding protein YcdF (DUF218 family)
MTQKSKCYDLIIIPGLKLGPNWGMRKDLKIRLKVAAGVYQENPGVHIVVSGRWSIWFDWLGVKPPVTESKRMKDYLITLGVRQEDITMESRSKDTPGNAYYVKRYVRTKPEYKKLLVICAAQHEMRLRFLFYKFFGNDYKISYLPIDSPRFDMNGTANEKLCLKEQKLLLAAVRPGHEEDFSHRLYKSVYYTRQIAGARKLGLVTK